LIQEQAAFSSRDANGNTPLMIMLSKQELLPLAKWLLEQDVEVGLDIRNYDHDNAENIAMKKGDRAIVNMLFDRRHPEIKANLSELPNKSEQKLKSEEVTTTKSFSSLS
jgi:ankyrin repeat protein